MSEFVRAQPGDKKPAEIVEAARAAGFKNASASYVYTIRSQAKAAGEQSSALKRAPRKLVATTTQAKPLTAHSAALQDELTRVVLRAGLERTQNVVNSLKATHALNPALA